jgi:serine/threonine protein phosphatase PrpC
MRHAEAFNPDPELIAMLQAQATALETPKTPEHREAPKFRTEYNAASFVCSNHEERNGDGVLGDRNRTGQRNVTEIAKTLKTTEVKDDARLIADMRESEDKAAPALQERQVSILTDGLGGKSRGEDAIATAVVLGIASRELSGLDPAASDLESMTALMKAAEEANEVLYSFKHKNNDGRAMELFHCGATFAMSRVVNGPDGRPRVPYVCGGNTRVLHFHGAEGRLEEVSLDDTVAGDAVRRGQNPDFDGAPKPNATSKKTMTPEEYRRVNDVKNVNDLTIDLWEYHQKKEDLTGMNRVIGFSPRGEFQPHAGIIEADPGDIVMLVTDGVHARLSLAELEERLRQGLDADEICLDAKNAQGHDDDTSAVVIRLKPAA